MTVIGSATLELRGDASHFQSTMARAGSQFRSVGRKMQGIGRRLTTSVTLPLAAMGAGAVKAFADFDSAMTESLAIMGDVSGTMRGEMVDAAREVGRTTTISATQAAEAYFFLASAGLDAEQSVAALAQVAAFAQAGMFDMAQATDLATDAQSALGLTVDDAQDNLNNLTRVTDVLVGANTLANASVEQFATALTSQAGAAMKSFGIDIEEGVAVLAAFADQGVKSQLAGTSFARVLRLMATAATNNAEELEALGISIFDAEGGLRNLGDIVANLETALGGLSDQQRTAALESIGFTARVQQAILPLLGTSDAIKEYEGNLRSMAGVTKEVESNQLQSFSAQMTLVKDNVIIAAQQIGEVLAPVVGRLGEFVKRAAQAIGEMNPTVIRWGVAIAGVAAVIGPLLVAAGALTAAVGVLLPVLAAISGPLAAISGPVGLVIAGVAAAGAAFVVWREEITAFLSGAFDKLKPTISAVMNVLKAFGGLVMEVAGPILKPLATVVGAVLVGSFKLLVEFLNLIVVPALNRIATVLTVMTDAFGAVKSPVRDAMQGVADFVAGGVDTIVSFIQSMIVKIKELLSAGFEAAIAPVKAGIDKVKGWFAGLKDFVVGNSVVPEMVDGVSEEMDRLVTVMATKSEAAVAAARSSFERLRSISAVSPDAIAPPLMPGEVREGAPGAVGGMPKLEMPKVNVEELDTATVSMEKKLEEFGKTAKDTMGDIGRDMVFGLINGTLSMGDILKKAVLRLASSFILGPLAGLFQFGSPSKLTKGYGRDIAMGLAVGIDSMRGAVMAASDRLANAAIPRVPAFAASARAASPISAPAGATEIRQANRPIQIYLPDPWADPDAFARSPSGQRYFRVADDVAASSGHRRG